jgi:MFS family permease
VKVLGWVSLLTDLGAHMIYPLLPAFLTGPLRAGPLLLGAVEGLAEAAASLVKVGSGWLSDRMPRKPLILAGYGVASVARPLLALATSWGQVLAIRLADRVGKGLRGAPRDALVAEVVAPASRGRAFGFHRAMDHAGAFGGPLLAATALAAGAELRTVFALSAIPAALSLLLLALGVRENRRSAPARRREEAPSGKGLGTALTRYLLAVGLFSLGNSSDAFLLLRAQAAGIAVAALPLLWAAHHLVKSTTATWGGALSDRLGRRRLIALGWGLYALVYAGFGYASQPLEIWGLFLAYALHEALTEGAERALVADLAPAESRGRAFGLYHAVCGATLLPASLLAGYLYEQHGPPSAFLTGALLSGLGALLVAWPTRS